MIKAISPILFVVVAVSLFFIVVDPIYEETKQLKVEAAAYDQALERVRQLNIKKEELVSKYNSFSTENVDRLKKLLPDAVDNVRLTLDMDAIAQGYNMRVQGIEVEEPQAPEGVVANNTSPYESVLMTFSVEGTYEDLVGFLAALEKSLRIVDVVELDFDAEEGGLNEFKITIQTYWLK